MEWLSWFLSNLRFSFFYMVNMIGGDKSNEHYEGKEKTLTFVDKEAIQPKDYVEGGD